MPFPKPLPKALLPCPASPPPPLSSQPWKHFPKPAAPEATVHPCGNGDFLELKPVYWGLGNGLKVQHFLPGFLPVSHDSNHHLGHQALIGVVNCPPFREGLCSSLAQWKPEWKMFVCVCVCACVCVCVCVCDRDRDREREREREISIH